MSAILDQLQDFPPSSTRLSDAAYDEAARKFVQRLQGTATNKLTGTTGSQDLLEQIDPATHSLSYLRILVAYTETKSSDTRVGGEIWGKIVEFLSVFDPIQVRYAGADFRKLLEAIERTCGTDKPHLAAELLGTAILRLDPTGATLTSSHLSLVRLSLRSRAYALALPVLEHDIYHVPTPALNVKGIEKEQPNIPLPCARHITSSTFITESSGLSAKLKYQDHILYFLYGAMIYIGVWEWGRALALLENALSAPTLMGSASMIQVEAYKKWVLVNLLVHGKQQSLPKNVSSQAAKHFKALSKAYDVVSDAFKDPDPNKLRAEIEAGPFSHDSNYSLALLVLSAHQRFKVLALADTYVSIPLSHVTTLALPPGTQIQETRAYVQNLIAKNQLAGATLGDNGSQSYLRFPPKGYSARSEADLYKDLVQQRAKVEILGAHIKDAQRKIEVNKGYVDAVRKARKADSKDGGHSQDIPMMSQEFDDDMVADM